jgi:tripartite-type tricarboxylate transporter receptor subunit TctC
MGQGDQGGQHQAGVSRVIHHQQFIEGTAMKFPRRQFLHLAAGAAALPALSRIARAQAWPMRPVRLVVGFAAGGGSDINARLIGQILSERLGQPFVIENRPGASTNIATETVVKALPDGYTLLMINGTNAINATLYDKLNFNFIRDIMPVGGVSRVANVMVVNPSFSAKTVPEFLAYAKANPGKLNMGSGGIGSAGHVSGELFKMMTGINMVHVPYRGAAPALTELLGGQVQMIFSDTSAQAGVTRVARSINRVLRMTVQSR